MRIHLNGDEREIESGQTIGGLLKELGIENRHIAIELNGRLDDGEELEDTVLHDGDRVEVVRFVGGG